MNNKIKQIHYKGYEIDIYQDLYAEPPYQDKSSFLVNYHDDFHVEFEEVVSKDDVRDLYLGKKIEQLKDYEVYEVSCLVHSGVWLSLSKSFSCDAGGWDTSHVGAVFIRKEDYPNPDKIAEGIVKEWNDYLQGNVYTYNVDGVSSMGGFYGDLEESGLLECAKEDIDYEIQKMNNNHLDKLKEWIKNDVPLKYREPSPLSKCKN